jgi:cytochrome c553
MIRLLPLLLLMTGSAWASTPQQILDSLVQEARQAQPGFTASAARGEQFYRAKQTGGKEADSCASCHTNDPKAEGKHIKTHKAIEPLAPVANKQRFTDAAHVEKWFRRNCREVLGRVCTAQEKADFTAYVLSVK